MVTDRDRPLERHTSGRFFDESEIQFTVGGRVFADGFALGCLQTNDVFNFFGSDPSGVSNVSALRLHHRGATSFFDFSKEPDDTRRVFDLMGMLLGSAEDTVYVVDEIERSLHPMLIRHFLEICMNLNAEKACQIVFSSHEASIANSAVKVRSDR